MTHLGWASESFHLLLQDEKVNRLVVQLHLTGQRLQHGEKIEGQSAQPESITHLALVLPEREQAVHVVHLRAGLSLELVDLLKPRVELEVLLIAGITVGRKE